MQNLILLSRAPRDLKRAFLIDAACMAAYAVAVFGVVTMGAVQALAVLS